MQSCDPNPESSYTKQYQKHEPSSFCYYIKCFDDGVYEPKLVSYTGKDAAQKFVDMLEEDIKRICSIPEKKIIFGEKERKRFVKETKCGICNGKFDGNVKIAILLVGIVEPLIRYVISCIENLILHLWCFITSVGKIATYS